MNWLLLILLSVSPRAHAVDDGSGAEEAVVERLIVYGSSYTLVLSPVEPVPATDTYLPALRGCDLFTVLGLYDSSAWKKVGRARVTPKDHQQALASLSEAFKKKKTIAFVHLGRTGLHPKLSRRLCVAESKGLELKDTEAIGFYYSYGDEGIGSLADVSPPRATATPNK